MRTLLIAVAVAAGMAVVAPRTQANNIGHWEYSAGGCGCSGTRAGIAAGTAWTIPSGQTGLESIVAQNTASTDGFQVGIIYQNHTPNDDCANSNPEVGFYEYIKQSVYTCHEIGPVGTGNNGYATERSGTCADCWEAFEDGSKIANSDQNIGVGYVGLLTAGGEIETTVGEGSLYLYGDFGDPAYGTEDHAWAATYGASCCNYSWTTIGSANVSFENPSSWNHTAPPSPFYVEWAG